MKKLQQIKYLIQQHTYFAVAIELLVVLVVTAIVSPTISAANLSDRSIQLSDSARSGGAITSGVGSGTNVVYKVGFTFPSNSSIAGVAIDFCSNSALIGDTCTAPAGFNVNRSTTTIPTQTGLGTGAMAIKTATETLNNRIIITRASAATVSTATPASIVFGTGAANNGFTNPNVNATFFARVYTYSTQTAANAHVTGGASQTGSVDTGAVALSINEVITITARVQENILFCVSAVAPTANCGGATPPTIQLGTGTTTKVIDSNSVYSGTIYSQVSTNAVSGVKVRIHGSNGSCGGLSSDGGTTCSIPAINGGAATTPTAAMAAGTAAFGLKIATATGVTPSAPYNATGTDMYGLDTTSADNMTTTYGSEALTSTGPVNNVTNNWTFAATASNVTPAGLYSINISTIATGTF